MVLLVSFLTLIGLARAGSILFWNVSPGGTPGLRAGGSTRLTVATLGLLGLSLLLAVAASPLKRYTDAAALQLADRGAYARAVLGPVGGAEASTTRPYRAGEGEVRLPAPKGL